MARAGSEFTVDGRGTVIVLPNEDEVLEAIAVGVPAVVRRKVGPGISGENKSTFWGVKLPENKG